MLFEFFSCSTKPLASEEILVTIGLPDFLRVAISTWIKKSSKFNYAIFLATPIQPGHVDSARMRMQPNDYACVESLRRELAS